MTYPINIWESMDALLIGREIHVQFVHGCMRKLRNNQSISLFYNTNIVNLEIVDFVAEVAEHLIQKKHYAPGDRLQVEMEVEWIEKCLRLAFGSHLKKTPIEERLDERETRPKKIIYRMIGMRFTLKEPDSIPLFYDTFPDFPKVTRIVRFKKTTERKVFFPPP